MPSWSVLFEEEFEAEFLDLPTTVRIAIGARVELLQREGPDLGRPFVDTLKGSKHPNMKELRFKADGGPWRVAFAFDPVRRAILLVAGNKSGIAERRFYKTLIKAADARFDRHLAEMKD